LNPRVFDPHHAIGISDEIVNLHCAFIIKIGPAVDATLLGRLMFHCLCSEFEEAGNDLERVIEAREPVAYFIGTQPFFEGLWKLPRWPELAKRMNLPDAK
jgi:hypothetical protein